MSHVCFMKRLTDFQPGATQTNWGFVGLHRTAREYQIAIIKKLGGHPIIDMDKALGS